MARRTTAPTEKLVPAQAPARQPEVGARPPRGGAHEARLLQRAYGNRGVARLASANLRVTQPDHELERMADRTTERLTGTSGAASHGIAGACPAQSETPLPPALEASISAARSSGQPLAGPLREPLEQALGADFRGVRLHTDARAVALSRALGARAFATGRDIFFDLGQFQPATAEGRHVLAHELAHVAQHERGQGETGLVQRMTYTLFDGSTIDTQDLAKFTKTAMVLRRKNLNGALISLAHELKFDVLRGKSEQNEERALSIVERALSATSEQELAKLYTMYIGNEENQEEGDYEEEEGNYEEGDYEEEGSEEEGAESKDEGTDFDLLVGADFVRDNQDKTKPTGNLGPAPVSGNQPDFNAMILAGEANAPDKKPTTEPKGDGGRIWTRRINLTGFPDDEAWVDEEGHVGPGPKGHGGARKLVNLKDFPEYQVWEDEEGNESLDAEELASPKKATSELRGGQELPQGEPAHVAQQQDSSRTERQWRLTHNAAWLRSIAGSKTGRSDEYKQILRLLDAYDRLDAELASQREANAHSPLRERRSVPEWKQLPLLKMIDNACEAWLAPRRDETTWAPKRNLKHPERFVAIDRLQIEVQGGIDLLQKEEDEVTDIFVAQAEQLVADAEGLGFGAAEATGEPHSLVASERELNEFLEQFTELEEMLNKAIEAIETQPAQSSASGSHEPEQSASPRLNAVKELFGAADLANFENLTGPTPIPHPGGPPVDLMNIILGMPLDKEGKPLIETAPLSPETPVGAAIGTSVSTGIYLLGAIATIKLAIDQLRGLKGLDDEQELEKQRVSASVNLQRGFYQLMSTATSTVKDGFSISKQLGTLGGDLIKNFDKIVNSLGVATAVFGIAVNGLNLIVSSYRAHKAGKRQRALEKLTVGEELKTEHAYALKRGKNKERRKGVEAGAAGLGLIAGGAAVAALLGVAMATPVGWGLAAGAGLVGMGMLGYKAGRKAYKYQHRKNKAKALVEGLLAGDETDRKTITELGLSPDALQQQIAKGGANGLEAARTAVYLKLKEKRTRYARTIFELLKQGSQDAKELVKALGFEDEAYLLKKDEDAAVKLIADKLTSW